MIKRIFNRNTAMIGLVSMIIGAIIQVFGLSNIIAQVLLILGCILFITSIVVSFTNSNDVGLKKIASGYFFISVIISLIMTIVSLSKNSNEMTKVYLSYLVVSALILTSLKLTSKKLSS